MNWGLSKLLIKDLHQLYASQNMTNILQWRVRKYTRYVGEMNISHKILSANLNWWQLLRHLEVDEDIILKYTLQKQCLVIWDVSIWSRIGTSNKVFSTQ